MDILHNGALIPDATPTGGPGTTTLNLQDGPQSGVTWSVTRAAGRVALVANANHATLDALTALLTSSPLTLTTGVVTLLPVSVSENGQDPLGLYSYSGGQISVSASGIYLVTGYISGWNVGAGNHLAILQSGGSEFGRNNVNGGLTNVSVAALASLGANSTVGLYGFQDSGGNETISFVRLGIAKVG